MPADGWSHSREEWFEGAGRVRLFCRHARPFGAPRALLVALHGLGDHSGLYPMLPDAFVPLGIEIFAPDLRGNGRSPGQRAYLESWSELREDLRRLMIRIRAEHPTVPLFVLGNSLGGLVALDYALLHPEGVRGVIAVSTPLGDLGVPRPLMALGRVLSRWWPRFSLDTGMDLSGLARDPEVVERVLHDPLFHRKGTARLSTEVTATIQRVQAGAGGFPVPLLLLHGGADRMVPPDGSRRFVGATGQPDRTLIEYPRAYHALLADVGGDQVLQDIAEWMARRAGM
ncbi:MAG TPA: alpha/beta hydrolase [Gemmatimonadales bacterium]|nr:alpha/beta hydrolase [Gemmatimonadales bacterium]